MTFSPFLFFCFTSLFPSLSPSQPIRNIPTSKRSQHRTRSHSQHPNDDSDDRLSSAIHDNLAVATVPFVTISPPQQSFADPHSRRSCHRNHPLLIPIRDDLAVVTIVCRSRSPSRRSHRIVLRFRSLSPSLLFAVVVFTVVAFACCHRCGSPSSLKLAVVAKA